MKRLLDLLSYVAFALVVVAVALRFQTVRPEWQVYAARVAMVGLALLVVYAAGQWREIAQLFSRRQARYGGLTTVSVLVFVGVLVAVNYIGKRQNKRWDLTAAKQYTLSDQSRNVLAKLDAPLQILVFTQENDFPRFRDRLREYEYGSKQVTTEFIDPDRNPAAAQQNQVQQYGTIIFSYKGRTERVTTDAEQDVTNGIIKVISGQQRKVFFTQGHGEKDTVSAERDGYDQIGQALGRENYTVEKIVLAQTTAVPADASVVVVAGPQTDFFPNEIDLIKQYLAKAGKLLLMLDPPARDDAAPLTNLIALANEWGVDVGSNVVVDVSGMGRLFGASEAVPVAASYPPHPITERFSVMTAYPLARSISAKAGGAEGRSAQPLVETSGQSWAEADLKGLFASKPAALSEAEGDKRGPISLAAAVSAPVGAAEGGAEEKKPGENEGPKPETRLVVFGDADFVSNATLGVPGNRDLFMNTIGWLSQQENLIAIRPKDPADRRVTLTSDQHNLVNWLAFPVIPGAILLMGVYSWMRRR